MSAAVEIPATIVGAAAIGMAALEMEATAVKAVLGGTTALAAAAKTAVKAILVETTELKAVDTGFIPRGYAAAAITASQ